MQTRDGISFEQLGEIYPRLPVSHEDKVLVADVVRQILQFLDAPPLISLKFDGEIVTNRRIFEVLMYGSISHANPDKVELHKKWFLESALPQFGETIFDGIIADLITTAVWLIPINQRAIEHLAQCLESEPL